MYEIGTQWKAREGHRTIVVDIPERGGTFWAWHSGDGGVYEHRLVDGGYCHDGSPDTLDLIEPWKEPDKGECWINICEYLNLTGGYYIGTGSSSFACKSDAANSTNVGKKRLACIKVKWTEGEGL